MSKLTIVLINAFIPVITGLIAWGGKLIRDLIKSKIENETIESVLTRVNEVVFSTVEELEQTLKKEWKKAAADGKITDKEKQELKDIAISKIKKRLGDKTLGLLKEHFGCVEDFILMKVESAVKRITEE